MKKQLRYELGDKVFFSVHHKSNYNEYSPQEEETEVVIKEWLPIQENRIFSGVVCGYVIRYDFSLIRRFDDTLEFPFTIETELKRNKTNRFYRVATHMRRKHFFVAEKDLMSTPKEYENLYSYMRENVNGTE